MTVLAALPRPASRDSLRAISYEDTVADSSPTLVTVIPPPSKTAPLKFFTNFRHSRLSHQHALRKTRSTLFDDGRRDSGLAPSTTSTARNSRITLGTDRACSPSIRHQNSLPLMSTGHNASKDKVDAGSSLEMKGQPPDQAPVDLQGPEGALNTQASFLGLLTEIPTSSLEDLTNPGQVQFSNRGSLLIGGKKAFHKRERSKNNIISKDQKHPQHLPKMSQLPSRDLSADEAIQSKKVRSMYQNVPDEDRDRLHTNKTNGQLDFSRKDPEASQINGTIRIVDEDQRHAESGSDGIALSLDRANDISREGNEMAGGIEDWDDLLGCDVDRYGFILPRNISSQPSSRGSPQPPSPQPARVQRMSTMLRLASDTPRKSRVRLGSIRSARSPTRSTDGKSITGPASAIFRPGSSSSSYRPTHGQSRLRSAANRLPHNKDRRFIAEAGDMLTLPPGLADIAEDQENNTAANVLKVRENQREEKWRKMAKVVKHDLRGGGMVFEFDVRSPKLLERTWKGIPDKWRATAWHAFLSASAKRRRGFQSDEELFAVFQALLNQGSPDDIQIDIDVPRTINSHIMFRRRYRGGQRLLFRVLHCMSIFFPETGYVQGMAAIAATLLCYFDEEMTFVMMVRLWQLRGLERLYKIGFEGLMQSLEEFEEHWLGSGEVATKLTELNIPPTSYGTRWYLTLFNYSIPFPAQLRIWDVFMLLDDPDRDVKDIGGLDVLHACSAALIDGTREILLDSDFENAMKVLTSWIPIKDEELMMQVAKAEWKSKRRRSRRH